METVCFRQRALISELSYACEAYRNLLTKLLARLAGNRSSRSCELYTLTRNVENASLSCELAITGCFRMLLCQQEITAS